MCVCAEDMIRHRKPPVENPRVLVFPEQGLKAMAMLVGRKPVTGHCMKQERATESKNKEKQEWQSVHNRQNHDVNSTTIERSCFRKRYKVEWCQESQNTHCILKFQNSNIPSKR